jgi:hypothetical protein
LRTVQSLLKARTYLDGKPVFYGDPTREYTSSIICSVELSIVKYPEGSKVYTRSDDQLLAAMRKLKFGQIGALKSGASVSSSETLCQILIPVTLNDVVKIKEACQSLFDLDSYMASKTCTVNGKPMQVKQAKDLISKYRESNRDIREKWISRSKALRTRGASSEEIIDQKKAAYSEYVSLSEYSMVIGVSITHYVHKPTLKSVVTDNCDEQTYNLFDYKEGKTRKVATHRDPIVSLPMNTLGDRDELLKYFKSLIVAEKLVKVSPQAEQLIIEDSILNNQSVDFAALRQHDQGILA